MQVFEPADAQSIINNFTKFANIGERMVGLPFYIGHPDHPDFKERYKDGKAYGRIKELQVRGSREGHPEDGLFANVKWSKEGLELLANEAYHGHSVVWHLRPTGKAREYRPVMLKSVGFTNEPNMPVTPISLAANEKENAMWKELAKQLGLKDDATEEQTRTKLAAVILAANEQAVTLEVLTKAGFPTVTDALAKVGTLSTELSTAKGVIAANETAIATLKTEKGTAETTANTLKVSFANERKARGELLINNSIALGRITEADRAKWTAEFANESTFESKEKELLAIKPTGGDRLNLGDRQSGIPHQSASMTQAVSEAKKIMANEKCTWDEAWQKCKTTHATLFANMVQPGKK
jgi:hypothetical protein